MNTLNLKAKDLLISASSIFLSPFIFATKFYNTPIVKSRQTLLDSYNNGLYHFTSNENADAIISSGEMYPSNHITSYGSRKCFFFSGIPSFDVMCINLSPDVKMTALKLKLLYEQLAQFDYRNSNDGAIMYKGVLDLRNIPVEKVRLVMKKNGELVYEEVSEEEYNNYDINQIIVNLDKINKKMALRIKENIIGIRKDLELLKKNFIKFTRYQGSGFKIQTRKNLIEEGILENSDLFGKQSKTR